MNPFLMFAIATSLVAIIFGVILTTILKKKEPGNEKMKEIANAIKEGAKAFLRREYIYLSIFVVIVAIVLVLLINPLTAVSFIVGGIFSAIAGYIGMSVATMANVRTAHAARSGINPALKIAFSSIE